ncbi:MAG: hypothetical protein GY708_19820 [Actinomycetia bacterium]|nr:hypothetical protein [Actinomycetes bacterium]MCP4963341.1 hypothetical protein [Actinomycetes bacterium]
MQTGSIRIRHRHTWPTRGLTALLATTLVLASCGVDDGVVDAAVGLPTSTSDSPSPGDTTDDTAELDIPLDTAPGRTETTVDTDTSGTAVIPTAVTSVPESAGAWGEVIVLIESFWDENFAAFAGSGTFTPLDRDRIVAVEDATTDLPDCDFAQIGTVDVEDNALAAACSEGQLIVWDDDDLFAELFQDFGTTGPTVVLAHEMGHAVQYQAGALRNSTLVVEQQADCLAGAYAAWATDRRISPFDSAAALDSAVGATVSFRDHPGASAAASDAHGSGFDRVRAFQDGFDRGVGYCGQYGDIGLPITEFPFQDQEDADTGGNLDFEALIDLVNPYFDALFATRHNEWPGMTISEEQLDGWRNAHAQIGDNATGTAMALMFAKRLQILEGAQSEGEGALLQQACLAGAAFAPLIFEDAELTPLAGLSLSPGDMDEAVLTMIRIVETNQDRLDDGFLFEAVAALRTGFTQGFDSCGI